MSKRLKLKTRRVTVALGVVAAAGLISVPAGIALSGTASYAPAESNIAGKYWVSASATAGDAKLAVDNDLSTAWTADRAPAALTVDLGGTYDAVHKVITTFSNPRAAHRYKVEGSTNGESWTLLADRAANMKPGSVSSDVFSHKGLRYLRLTVTGGDVGVKDFKVVNYLRPDMDNGCDCSEQGGNTNAYYYNAGNTPPVPGIRGGRFSDAGSIASGNNFFGLVNDLGWDTTRLRVWNEPRSETTGNPSTSAGNNSPENTRRVAKAVVGAGQNLAIDLHYSDSWADPHNQPKPYAWSSLPFDQLVDEVYKYTYDFTKSLVDQGTTPTIVAIGNEIINGMLWGSEYDTLTPYLDYHHYYTSGRHLAAPGGGVAWLKYEEARGDTSSPAYQEFLASLDRLARLVDAGNRAVRAVNAEKGTKIDTQLHFALNLVERPRGLPEVVIDPDKKYAAVLTLIDHIKNKLAAGSGMVDRIGLSYYADWHGTYNVFQKFLVDISRAFPGVKMNIAENSPKYQGTVTNPLGDANHPVGFAYSIQSQGDDAIDLMKTINDIPDNRGTGMWPWAGTNVFGTGTGANGTLRASFKAFNDAFAKNVLESEVSVTTDQGAAPGLPATVKSLDLATGAVNVVPVNWAPVDPADYANAGAFTVKGTAAVSVSSTGRGQAMTAVTATVDVGTFRNGDVGGTVPATLSLTLGAPATFGAFAAGVEKEYTAATSANVISTAGDAALTVSEPGHLANGAFSLAEPLRVQFSKASWTGPVSNDSVDIGFKQLVKRTDPLRTGSYSKTLTFTLATTAP